MESLRVLNLSAQLPWSKSKSKSGSKSKSWSKSWSKLGISKPSKDQSLSDQPPISNSWSKSKLKSWSKSNECSGQSKVQVLLSQSAMASSTCSLHESVAASKWAVHSAAFSDQSWVSHELIQDGRVYSCSPRADSLRSAPCFQDPQVWLSSLSEKEALSSSASAFQSANMPSTSKPQSYSAPSWAADQELDHSVLCSETLANSSST
mmetsp:Transcript_14599/g.41595  ORF Transcript_14599/g.41595 Transcript_14599/m.41595 type:complete len:206 (-) Transcript_14599:738-1355(-)